jgi:uncharacterized DUF497 family protein
MTFRWNETKNRFLKQTRGVSFEEIVVALSEGDLVDVLEHPNTSRHPHQRIYLVRLKNYIYAVPFVRDASKEEIFLKTIYPSRRHTARYRPQEGER